MIQPSKSIFAFGRNRQSFARHALTPERIDNARYSFARLFIGIDLRGKPFLDVGFGQGLSLPLAQEPGAKICGIDVDAGNLEALEISPGYFGSGRLPEIRIVSILDDPFVVSQRDKYESGLSWGVLRHMGHMWKPIRNITSLVGQNGYLVIAIYNKYWSSPVWRAVKWAFKKPSQLIQKMIVWVLFSSIYAGKWLVAFEDPKIKQRGMDFFHDLVDWVGGYPYEYSKPKRVVEEAEALGFECLRVIPPAVPTGCNEFMFRKS